MPEKEIKTIITDLGNVVLFFDLELLTYNLKRRSRLFPEEFDKRFGPFCQPWSSFIQGKITAVNFYEQMGRLLGLNITYSEFVEIWCNIFRPNKFVIDTLRELRKGGYKIVLLSNLDELHHDWVKSYFILDFLDEEIYSFEQLCGKPDVKIYKAAFKVSGRRSKKECVFIDDLKPNVIEADRYGLRAIQYCGDNVEFLAKLRELGIKV